MIKPILQIMTLTVLTCITKVTMATVMTLPELKIQVEHADLIARVQLVSTEVIHSPSDGSFVCGYLNHAHILESIKGQPKQEITFYSGKEIDQVEYVKTYLLIATKYQQNEPKPEAFIDYPECKNVNQPAEYYISDLYQTLFPLSVDIRTGEPYELWVGRKSAFTPDNTIGHGDFDVAYSISGDRIFLRLDYKKAIEVIKSYLPASRGQK